MRGVLAVGLSLLMLVGVLPVQAQPNLAEEVPCATNPVVGAVTEERFFCEPLTSTFFVQFEQFLAGLEYLDETYPDYIEVREIGKSVEGRPLLFVEVTNELSATPRDQKIQMGYSASIHANEPAGREGMLRVIEDLAGAKGPYGTALQPILDDVILNVWFPNPDSWAAGDYFSSEEIHQLHPPVGFARSNAAGVDLNREFPSPGWISPPHTPMSEPESRAVVDELRFSGRHSNLATGTDLHGMPASPNFIRSIIPNQDYDFRRMVLIVEQLRSTQERVESNPAYAEWEGLHTLTEILSEGAEGVVPQQCVGLVVTSACANPEDTLGRAYEWGARWDMIGYTDSGFTSDYLMMSPRSPTGGMGAVGTIVEFSVSHIVPDNRYVAKFIDMHVQGVREIVRTQLETAGRLETPMLSGTGPVAYLDDGWYISSDDDPYAYLYEGEYPYATLPDEVEPETVGQRTPVPEFDLDDPEARYEFRQVPYNVSNLNFWRDLGRFSADPVDPIDAASFSASDLAGYEHLVITNQVLDSLFPDQVDAIAAWVDGGGHVLLTDSAIRFLDQARITDQAVAQECVYLGHSDVQDWDHPLMEGVDWAARVTGEGPAIGYAIPSMYPQWGVMQASFEAAGGQTVGTTSSFGTPSPGNGELLGEIPCQKDGKGTLTSVGRIPHGSGSIDIIGGALPKPTQSFDHRYGLADYSVSAFTYWLVMNSLGGEVAWQPLESPFIPAYDYDPLYGSQGVYNPNRAPSDSQKPDGPVSETPFVAPALLLIALAVLARRR